MNWKNNKSQILECILKDLDTHGFYHDSTHKRLFHEITHCYCDKSFFTPGMIKCMYMASWDEEHFAQLLNQLMLMSFTSEQEGLHDMAENGELMAEESIFFKNSTDACLYQLSCSFIEDEPFDLNSIPEDLNEHGKAVLDLTLKAAELIDRIILTSR